MARYGNRKRLSLDEIHDLLMDEEHEDEIFAIEPPMESAIAETDCDSDCSDDEVTCHPDHLPRRVLLANVITESDEQEENIDQPTTSAKVVDKKCRKETYIWHRDVANIVDTVPDYEADTSNIETNTMESILEHINHYWTDEWLDYICQQSKLYAQQKSLAHDSLTRNNLRVFFGILILSGYNKLPNRRLYWSQMEDVQNLLVVNSMRRDSFEQIMRCLHFANNMLIDNDRFYKVRPIFKHLNETMKINKADEFLSVDEIMVPYYGRHGDKQYIRGKPVTFGYKLWGAGKSDGTLLHVEPYCGSNTKIPDHGLGHGPNVVMEMINKTELTPGQHVICDNYFGSIGLLKELSDKRIALTTTLREDRLGKAPLKPRKFMNKEKRGSLDEAFSESLSVIKWKDNKVVSVGSNKLRANPIQTARRWDRVARRYTQIDVPHSVHVYNKHMGGIDLFDQQVSAYRVRIRSKKWWWPLFAWSLNAQVVNAWFQYRKKQPNISLLEFSRNLVTSLLKSFGVQRKQPGPKSHPSTSILDEVRYNNQQHWTAKGDQKHCRCRQCGKRTHHICKMCNLPVHPECMEAFHTKD